ncbi:hypothetical protein PNP85_08110 [Halobacterium salinarum]|uniref:hypothetical protein n=1 Tax=Halobacterium salinarum TaxID=2242 RepID=UPI0025577113|nr:hypothetical protein [Halobacterium salinarum]MDL0139465.1 hypothetical protein [Halobacterium salinarum]
MRPADMTSRIGAFVLVAVIVAAAIVGPGMIAGGSGSFSAGELSVPGHDSPNIATQPVEEGQIEMSATTSGKVVVIDEAHGNGVGEFQLRPLINTLTENGHEVRFYGPDRGPSGEQLNKTLRGADAFVSLAPDNRFKPAEADGVSAFVDAGGRVLAAGEPESGGGGGLLGIGGFGRSGRSAAEFTPVLSQYGLTVGSGYLYDTTDNVNNHANIDAAPTGSSDLTAGVDSVVVHQAAPVTGNNVLLQTDSETELTTTRDADAYGVLARTGNIVALGDSSVLDPDWTYVADNEVLVGNLADYLVTGDRGRMPAPSE